MDTTTVLIIGSGFGGQVTAINLLRRGITDFRILERRDFMGGTWCQNSYPGAAVDVPSPLYSIASEPYPWTRMYAEQAELRDYTEHVIDRHRLRERTVLGAEVVSARVGRRGVERADERRRRSTAAASWSTPPARSAPPSCPTSPGSTTSRATPSTPTAGTTTST